jgi:hypothetical protein
MNTKSTKEKISAHVASISSESRRDMSEGQWDEAMADSLYAACQASSGEEMAAARWAAQSLAEIHEAFDKISPEAMTSGRDADGIEDGSNDWDHPSACQARKVTKDLGMVWDFTTWEDAKERSLAVEMTPTATATVLNEEDIVNVKRWAASRFASTYYYFRTCLVKKNRHGKLFLKPIGTCYGRRGFGSLALPPVKPATFPDGTGLVYIEA